MKNNADLGRCFQPRPSASVGNTLRDLHYSSYPTQPHSIIANYVFSFAMELRPCLHVCLHGVLDPGLVGLVSFVFTLWGTQNKRNLPH